MAFVNERIPEADVEKYGLEKIDDFFFGAGATTSRDWTIDRARDIYLREVARGRDELSRISTWTFYWKGALIWFKREELEFKGTRGTPCWSHARVYNFDIPRPLQNRRKEIFRDLHDAFLAYKTGGIYATCTEYSMQLDIDA
mgnify:FL=1